MYRKFVTAAVLAVAAAAISTGPVLAGPPPVTDLAPNGLPAPGVLGLVAIGIIGAIALARSRK